MRTDRLATPNVKLQHNGSAGGVQHMWATFTRDPFLCSHAVATRSCSCSCSCSCSFLSSFLIMTTTTTSLSKREQDELDRVHHMDRNPVRDAVVRLPLVRLPPATAVPPRLHDRQRPPRPPQHQHQPLPSARWRRRQQQHGPLQTQTGWRGLRGRERSQGRGCGHAVPLAGERDKPGVVRCGVGVPADVEADVGGGEPAHLASAGGCCPCCDVRGVDGADGPAPRAVERQAQILGTHGEERAATVR
ncbi:unnamed protein product [Ectocarpus sp. 12 AP-2014]